MTNLNFNAANVEPYEAFEPVPAGEYLAMIVDSEMKDTKAGNGSYLNIKMEILDGPSKGRTVFDLLNLQNPSQKAVEIAQRTLSAICHATGVIKIEDSSELHGKPMLIKVSIKPADDQYEASNVVKSYKPAKARAAPDQNPPSEQPSKATPW